MNSEIIKILRPGPCATIQDQGRFGFQDRGVPVSGPMDPIAYRIGNRLVGNRGQEAALEVTLGGFRAEFLDETRFAVTGANSGVRLNDQLISPWTCHQAVKGDVLSLEFARKGARDYLTLAGGFDVPLVMGSRSTYLPGRFGGYQGRALIKGDIVRCGIAKQTPRPIPIPEGLIPPYARDMILRVVLGPQDDEFNEESLFTFLNAAYEVTQRSDRMGCLLEGPPVRHKRGADIISDGTAFGSIQVPGSGQPIILMADRQTTGGYVKIATVISMDLPLIAQALPGYQVRFEVIGLKEARELVVEREKKIKDWVGLMN
jgi:biotin-dependent carboxylase-like uncharacterized protein